MVELAKKLDFFCAADALKGVLRQNLVIAGDRRENTAEHSWSLALGVLVFKEHAAAPVRLERCLSMALVHDLVEIEAGDTFVYDDKGSEDKAERERLAADRLFGRLPATEGREFRALWDEFEERTSPEARYVAAIDRFLPLLFNAKTGGHSWKKHGVRAGRVLEVNGPRMRDGAPDLWPLAQELVAECIRLGHLST